MKLLRYGHKFIRLSPTDYILITLETKRKSVENPDDRQS